MTRATRPVTSCRCGFRRPRKRWPSLRPPARILPKCCPDSPPSSRSPRFPRGSTNSTKTRPAASAAMPTRSTNCSPNTTSTTAKPSSNSSQPAAARSSSCSRKWTSSPMARTATGCPRCRMKSSILPIISPSPATAGPRNPRRPIPWSRAGRNASPLPRRNWLPPPPPPSARSGCAIASSISSAASRISRPAVSSSPTTILSSSSPWISSRPKTRSHPTSATTRWWSMAEKSIPPSSAMAGRRSKSARARCVWLTKSTRRHPPTAGRFRI